MLKKKGNISRIKKTYELGRYVDSERLLRLIERVSKGEKDANIAHPVLLPKKTCISAAIIRWCHEYLILN